MNDDITGRSRVVSRAVAPQRRRRGIRPPARRQQRRQRPPLSFPGRQARSEHTSKGAAARTRNSKAELLSDILFTWLALGDEAFGASEYRSSLPSAFGPGGS